ncbi:sigma-54-dependent transcriptional regulator [Desulfoluna spongiiphila]|uniref:Two-component system, NtrC family, C4-dicarboxylate transport response regulator DctD n=1 Tax=Desulfoluna spongiiphila TaxID=419481 RepID=A0A1G5FLD8_9BACT|nr:sigma-54 dependent transcriptional regulator [Desulfoluna spongiiphila]SCY39971.1 two-component system, NtrC family, C4-dicarboxylate transport response regulator DctD [Desulfoluna spongiiphila]
MRLPLGEIFLVDDEEEIRIASSQTFELEGYAVRTFASAAEVLSHISPDWLGVVITDVKMPGMDGLELLAAVLKIAPDLPVVIQTGHGDVPMALAAMQAGAYDFIEKPVPPEYLIDVAKRALESRRLSLENQSLRARLGSEADIGSRIIGESPAATELRRTIGTLSLIDVDVLLIGETGVGKELAAHCLHDLGSRKAGKFVPLNCGAIPPNLVESELFGHERGAFTSASTRRIGKIEQAQGGTLFLDEIESMPLSVQVKVLRALQERTIERVGGDRLISVDFRVIAATKVNLRDAVTEGAFREDLFYRLNVARVPIPPLRERTGDVRLLLQWFLMKMADRFHAAPPAFDPDMARRLEAYDWPGNVRELRNVAQQLVLGLPLDLAEAPCCPGMPEPEAPSGVGLDARVRLYEKKLIEEALAKNGGSMTLTARELDIPRKRLYLRMQKFHIHK